MISVARTTVAACCIALLSACGGGSGGNAAVSRTFDYGPAQQPTAAEQAAASSAQRAVSDTAAFGSTPDGTKALAIAGMAYDLAGSALGGGLIPGRFVPGSSTHPALRSASAIADCAKVVGNTVTFTNCSEVESGITLTLNGKVTATSGAVDWDVTAKVAGSDSGVSVNVTIHESGSIKVTSTTIDGSALVEVSGSASDQRTTVNLGVSVAAILKLTYQPDCITSGSLEVKRVWTQVPQGASGSEFTDAGVKLTWSSCNSVLVAHSQ